MPKSARQKKALLFTVAICLGIAVLVILSPDWSDQPNPVTPASPDEAQTTASSASRELASVEGKPDADRQEEEASEAPQPADPSPVPETMPPLSLREGELFLGDDALASVNLEAWPVDALNELIHEVQDLQRDDMRRVLEIVPKEVYFVPATDWESQGRWREDRVFYRMSHTLADDSGETSRQLGYLEVPRTLSPESYVLRDAMGRIFETPAYARKILERGTAKEAQVLEDHPQASLEVSPDLTRWIFTDPDGTTVGFIRYSKCLNN